MSVELPEARILAEQMSKELKGKVVQSYLLQDCERLQRIGMVDKELTAFNQLVNAKVEAVSSRGNVIRVEFDNGVSLILGPEYGGEIFYNSDTKNVPKFHLRVEFTEGSVLTVRLTSMGVIQAVKNEDLDSSYIYRRDFDDTKFSPVDEEFTFEKFSREMEKNNKMLKSVLVGKNAFIVGVSNSTFQDILYRAKIHPKRKASELNIEETRSLYAAIKLVLTERIRFNGKDQFHDLYGKKGKYVPTMGPSMKGQTCPECGNSIQKLILGGGHIYLCPSCQKQ